MATSIASLPDVCGRFRHMARAFLCTASSWPMCLVPCCRALYRVRERICSDTPEHGALLAVKQRASLHVVGLGHWSHPLSDLKGIDQELLASLEICTREFIFIDIEVLIFVEYI